MVKAPEDYQKLLERSKPAIISFDQEVSAVNCIHDQYLVIQAPYTIEIHEIENLVKDIHEEHVVMVIHNPLWWRCSAYKIPDGIKATITHLKQLNKTVTVGIFGSPYSVDQVQEADAIVLGYEDTFDAIEAAAAILRII